MVISEMKHTFHDSYEAPVDERCRLGNLVCRSGGLRAVRRELLAGQGGAPETRKLYSRLECDELFVQAKVSALYLEVRCFALEK
jgi:hypothetical protein